MNMQRDLHIYYRDGHSRLDVTDSDKHTVLYTVHRASSKPHMKIFRAATPSTDGFLIGQVSFHHFSSAIDLEVPYGTLVMRKTGQLFSNYEVHGKNISWRWERDGALTSNIKLMDCMGGGVLARFENASFSVKKQGTLAVFGQQTWEALDAIVITGLAKIECQRRANSARSGAVGATNPSILNH